MNEFTSFIASFCLIAVGLLIGWVASASFGSNSWNALSAIGSWIGGIGALAAAGAALFISHKQEIRDTYKLSVSIFESFGKPIASFVISDEVTGKVIDRGEGFIVVRAQNSGLRSIEIVEIRYEYDGFKGALALNGFVVDPGRRAQIELKDKLVIIKGGSISRVWPNRLLDCNVTVMDAAGVIHEVHKVR